LKELQSKLKENKIMKLIELKSKYSTISGLIMILIMLVYYDGYTQQPALIWVGTLGGTNSEARSVSSDGSVVVGVSDDSNDQPRAFRWTISDGIQDLGTLGGDWSEATGVSADGSVIVGWSYDANGIYRAFKWTEATGMQDLGAGDYSKAYGVSADGEAIIVDIYPDAYRWTQTGGLQNLGTLGGASSSASDISANGSIICGSSYVSAGDPYAFRWVDGVGMGQVGTFYSFALGVSADGSTVTGFETGAVGFYRAFRWTQSGGFEFNIAGNFSQGNSVSGDGGIIVGDYAGGAFRLSASGGLEELDQVYSNLLSSGSELSTALDISPDGQYIVGEGLNAVSGEYEGYLIAVNGINAVDETQRSPVNFVLQQNYPNPFNPSTTIRYSIPASLNPSKGGTLVTLKVYDVLGNEVALLVNEELSAGLYEVEFSSNGLSSGIYFYKLQVDSFTETRKMILIR
jgi:probable HAF family extracellular repeat protein